MRKTKKNFYKALDEKQVFDSKTFWKNVRPFFSDNGVNSSKITLVEKNAIVVDKDKIANVMNNYFINITKNLNLNPVDKNKVAMFENHISLKKIMKPFRILFQRTFTSKKYPKMIKEKKYAT